MNSPRWDWLVMATVLAAAGVLLVIAALAECGPQSSADLAPAQVGQPSSATGQEILIDGTISAIDTSARTLTVRSPFLSKTVTVGPDAQIIAIDGETSGRLSDLKVGDSVEVTYHKQGEALVADEITRKESKR